MDCKRKSIAITTSLGLLVVLLSFKQANRPALFIIGDSTVRNYASNQKGWGDVLVHFFDTAKIEIKNYAMPGRSTRTFIKEGRWGKVLHQLSENDFLIMQFGHNEGARPDTTRQGYRGVLRGTGDQTTTLTWADHTKEVVHTYGWYLTKFVEEAKAKGVIVFVCSMIPRNRWDEQQRVYRSRKDFGGWAQEVADKTSVHFIDLNNRIADQYDAWGKVVTDGLFGGDHTHTNEAGARINAYYVKEEIKGYDTSLRNYLKNQ